MRWVKLSAPCLPTQAPPTAFERGEEKRRARSALSISPNPSNRVVLGVACRKRRGCEHVARRNIRCNASLRSPAIAIGMGMVSVAPERPHNSKHPFAPIAVFRHAPPGTTRFLLHPPGVQFTASVAICRLSAIGCSPDPVDWFLPKRGREKYPNGNRGRTVGALLSTGNFHSELRLKPALSAAARPIRAITTFTVSHMHSSAAGTTPMPSLRR